MPIAGTNSCFTARATTIIRSRFSIPTVSESLRPAPTWSSKALLLRRHATSNIFSRKDAPHEACDIQGHLCSSPSAHASGDTWSSAQFLEQGLCLFQIKRVEAFGEPAVDRSEQIASLIPRALIAPQPRHADGRAQFPGFCLLLTRDRERLLEYASAFATSGCGAASARLAVVVCRVSFSAFATESVER